MTCEDTRAEGWRSGSGASRSRPQIRCIYPLGAAYPSVHLYPRRVEYTRVYTIVYPRVHTCVHACTLMRSRYEPRRVL